MAIVGLAKHRVEERHMTKHKGEFSMPAKKGAALVDTRDVGTPHPGGRPSKYAVDMVGRLEAYMRDCPDELPSKAGFAIHVGVCENTLTNWGGKHPEFLRALEQLHTRQHVELINRGLNGTYNAALAKLILCSNHGYRDREDTTTGDKPLTPQIVCFADLVSERKAD